MRHVIPVLFAVTVALIGSGCASPRSSTTETITTQIPVLTPKGNAWAESNGVKMTFSVKEPGKKDYIFGMGSNKVNVLGLPYVGDGMASLLKPGDQAVHLVDYKSFTLLNPDIEFSVRVSNNTDQHVRLSNAVVTYTNNGSVMNLDQAKFAKLVKVVVPPKATAEITVPGMLLGELTAGDLDVSLFDIQIGDSSKGTFKVSYAVNMKDYPILINSVQKKEWRFSEMGTEENGMKLVLQNWKSKASFDQDTSEMNPAEQQRRALLKAMGGQ